MTAYIIKHALDIGIFEVEGEMVGNLGSFRIAPGVVGDEDSLLSGDEWCGTKKGAICAAEEMRREKLRGIYAQITSLNATDLSIIHKA